MARSLRVVGLACAILFAGVAAVAAQSETWSAPPIRLPGIAYPKPADAGVRATTPKLKPKAQSDRTPSAPKTTQGARVAPEGRITSTPTPGEHSLNVKLPGVAYPAASATRAVAPTAGPKSTQHLEVPAAREPPSSIPIIPPETPIAPQTSHGLLAAPGAKEEGTSAPLTTIMQQREAPKMEPTPEPQPAGNNGQQKSKTEAADTATHAISAPEPGSSSATLPNRKDALPREDFAPSFPTSNKSEPPPEAQPSGDDGRQRSETETADTATHAISAPEPGSSTALPNGKDTSAATTLVSREDFAPSLLKSNQQNSVSDVVVPDKVPELFFRKGAKIIELLQATDYSDYAPHEIPPEVIALEPALAIFRFVKRPDERIGLVSGLSPITLGILK